MGRGTLTLLIAVLAFARPCPRPSTRRLHPLMARACEATAARDCAAATGVKSSCADCGENLEMVVWGVEEVVCDRAGKSTR